MTQVSNSRNRLSDVERQGRKRKKKLVRKENYNTDPTVALTQDEDPYDWLIRREQVEMEGVSVHSEAALIEGERLSNTLRYLLKLDYDGTRDSIYATNGNFNGLSWMHVKTGAHIAYSKEHQDHLNYLHHITKDAPRITKASQLRAIFDSLRKIDLNAIDLYAMQENDAALTIAALYVVVSSSNIALHHVPSSILRVLRDRALVFMNIPALLKSGSATARYIQEIDILCKLQDRFHAEALTTPLPFEVNTQMIDEAFAESVSRGGEPDPSITPSGKMTKVNIRASIFNNPDFQALYAKERQILQDQEKNEGREKASGKGKDEDLSEFSVYLIESDAEALQRLRLRLENEQHFEEITNLTELKRFRSRRTMEKVDAGKFQSGMVSTEDKFLSFRHDDGAVNNDNVDLNAQEESQVNMQNMVFSEDSRDYCDASIYQKNVPLLSQDLSTLQKHFSRYMVGGVQGDAKGRSQFIPYKLMTDVLSLHMRNMIISRDMTAVHDVMAIAMRFAQPHLIDYSWISLASHMHGRLHNAMKHNLTINDDTTPYKRLIDLKKSHTKEQRRLQHIFNDCIQHHHLNVPAPRGFDARSLAQYSDIEKHLAKRALRLSAGGIYLYPSQFFNLSLRAEADAVVHDSMYMLSNLYPQPHSPLTQHMGDKDPVFSGGEHMQADPLYNIAKRLRANSLSQSGMNENGLLDKCVSWMNPRETRRYNTLATMPWVRDNRDYCENIGLYSHPVMGRATLSFLEEMFFHFSGPDAPFAEWMQTNDYDSIFTCDVDAANCPERPLSLMFENPDSFLQGPGLQLSPFGGMSRQPQTTADTHFLRQVPILSPSFYSGFIEATMFQHYGLPHDKFTYNPTHAPLSLYSDVATDNPFLNVLAARAHEQVEISDADALLLFIMQEVGPRPNPVDEENYHDWYLDVITQIRQLNAKKITGLLTSLHPRILLGMDPRVIGMLMSLQAPTVSQTLTFKYIDALHAVEEIESQNRRDFDMPVLNSVETHKLRTMKMYYEALNKGTYDTPPPVNEVVPNRRLGAKTTAVNIDVEDIMATLRKGKGEKKAEKLRILAENRNAAAVENDDDDFYKKMGLNEADISDDLETDSEIPLSDVDEEHSSDDHTNDSTLSNINANVNTPSSRFRDTVQFNENNEYIQREESEIQETMDSGWHQNTQVPMEEYPEEQEFIQEEEYFENPESEEIENSQDINVPLPEDTSFDLLPDSRDVHSLAIAHNITPQEVDYAVWSDIVELLQLKHVKRHRLVLNPRDDNYREDPTFHTSSLSICSAHSRNSQILGKARKNQEYIRMKAGTTYPPVAFASRTQQTLTLSYILNFAPQTGVRAPVILANLPDSHHTQMRHWLLPALGLDQHYYRTSASQVEGENLAAVHLANVKQNYQGFLYQMSSNVQTRYLEMASFELGQKNANVLTALHMIISYLRSIGTEDIYIFGNVLSGLSRKYNFEDIRSFLVKIAQKRDAAAAANPYLELAMRMKDSPADHLHLSRGFISNRDMKNACKHLLLAFGCYETLPIPSLPNSNIFMDYVNHMTEASIQGRPLSTIHDAVDAITKSNEPDAPQKITDGETLNAYVQLLISVATEREKLLSVSMKKFAETVKSNVGIQDNEQIMEYLNVFNKPMQSPTKELYRRVYLPSGVFYRNFIDLLLTNDRYKDALKILKIMMRTDTLLTYDLNRIAGFTSVMRYICYRLQDVELAMLIWTEASTKYPYLITSDSIQPAITIAIAQGRCELARRLLSIALAKKVPLIGILEEIRLKLFSYTPLSESDAFSLATAVSRPPLTAAIPDYSRPADLPRLISRKEMVDAILTSSARDTAENASKAPISSAPSQHTKNTPQSPTAPSSTAPPPPRAPTPPPAPTAAPTMPTRPPMPGVGLPRAPAFKSPAAPRSASDSRKYYSTKVARTGGMYERDKVKEVDIACYIMGLN